MVAASDKPLSALGLSGNSENGDRVAIRCNTHGNMAYYYGDMTGRSIGGGNDFSFSVWVKDDLDSGAGETYGRFLDGNYLTGYVLCRYDHSAETSMLLQSTGGANPLTGATLTADWKLFVVTYNGTTGATTVYFDGSVVFTGTSPTLGVGLGTFAIGNNHTTAVGGDPFFGGLDYPAYWDCELTSGEAAALLTDKPDQVAAGNLIEYWGNLTNAATLPSLTGGSDLTKAVTGDGAVERTDSPLSTYSAWHPATDLPGCTLVWQTDENGVIAYTYADDPATTLCAINDECKLLQSLLGNDGQLWPAGMFGADGIGGTLKQNANGRYYLDCPLNADVAAGFLAGYLSNYDIPSGEQAIAFGARAHAIAEVRRMISSQSQNGVMTYGRPGELFYANGSVTNEMPQNTLYNYSMGHKTAPSTADEFWRMRTNSADAIVANYLDASNQVDWGRVTVGVYEGVGGDFYALVVCTTVPTGTDLDKLEQWLLSRYEPPMTAPPSGPAIPVFIRQYQQRRR